MKGLLILLTVFGLFIQNARAQDHEVTQLLLNVEKLAQFREIYSNMLKGYNIVSGGYAGIRDISQGNFGLHRAFMTGLEQVNPSVAGYRKVGETVKMHSVILLEGRKMIRSYYDTGLSRPQELEYFQKVYSNIFNLSLRNLDELLTIVASGALVMSDEERMTAIDRIHKETQDMYLFMADFDHQVNTMTTHRKNQKSALETAESLLGRR